MSIMQWWMPVFFSLVLGLLLGYWFARFKNRRLHSDYRSLQKSLNQIETVYENFQQQVNLHFNETAELINQLTTSYQAVHHHLTKGAQALCQTELPVAFQEEEKPEQIEPQFKAPPRDYSPESQLIMPRGFHES